MDLFKKIFCITQHGKQVHLTSSHSQIYRRQGNSINCNNFYLWKLIPAWCTWQGWNKWIKMSIKYIYPWKWSKNIYYIQVIWIKIICLKLCQYPISFNKMYLIFIQCQCQKSHFCFGLQTKSFFLILIMTCHMNSMIIKSFWKTMGWKLAHFYFINRLLMTS